MNNNPITVGGITIDGNRLRQFMEDEIKLAISQGKDLKSPTEVEVIASHRATMIFLYLIMGCKEGIEHIDTVPTERDVLPCIVADKSYLDRLNSLPVMRTYDDTAGQYFRDGYEFLAHGFIDTTYFGMKYSHPKLVIGDSLMYSTRFDIGNIEGLPQGFIGSKIKAWVKCTSERRVEIIYIERL